MRARRSLKLSSCSSAWCTAEHELRLFGDSHEGGVERDEPRTAAALAGRVAAGVIDHDEAHGARHHAVEMGPALPVDRLLVEQPQVGLVDQGDGVERAPRGRLAQLLARHLFELAMRELDQTAEGVRIPRPMLLQEPRQIAAESVFHGDGGTRSRRSRAPKEGPPARQLAARTTGRATSLRRRNQSVQGGS